MDTNHGHLEMCPMMSNICTCADAYTRKPLETMGVRASRSKVLGVLSVDMLFIFFCSHLVLHMSCLLHAFICNFDILLTSVLHTCID